jgi:hypothetical protein
MNPITYREAVQMLRQAGFVGAEIDRLYQLRRTYRASELDQPPLDLCRLRFARWLVETGRLSDHLPKMREPAAARLSEEAERLDGTPLARFAFPWWKRKEFTPR